VAAGTQLDDELHDTVGRTALVVEDEPAVRRLVERCLSQIGLGVLTAADAGEARDRLATGDVDLLVTDLGLPGESGIDFLRSLAPDDRPAVLILTGSEDSEAVQSSLDLGAFGYIVKPPTIGGLQVAAAGALRQKNLERVHRSTIAILRDDLAARTAAGAESAHALTDALGALSRAIESRDLVTGDHVYRMAATCALLAAELGMSTDEQHALALAARLHDVGTVTVPDRLLLKGSALDERELWICRAIARPATRSSPAHRARCCGWQPR